MKSKATGFYREDAARIVSEAARASQPPRPAPEPAPTYVPPVLLDSPARPPLTPQPPTNQNIAEAPRPVRPARTEPTRSAREEPTRRPASLPRLVARLILLPLYVVVAAASLALLLYFGKALVGL